MPEILALWPDGAKGSEDWSNEEKNYSFTEPWPHRITRNVINPTLTIFLPEPESATGTGVIICPGGGYHFLAVDHEGYDVARWLNMHGIAAFVLKYRVFQTPDQDAEFLESRKTMAERIQNDMLGLWPLVLADAQQALRMVRKNAAVWHLKPDRIGMMGFSAGANLTVGLTLLADAAHRPDFIAPIYGARFEAFMDAAALKNDLPPLFTALASNDPIAVETSLDLYAAWRKAGCSAELHCYAQGAHGFGMILQGLPSDSWIERFYEWLSAQGLVEE